MYEDDEVWHKYFCNTLLHFFSGLRNNCIVFEQMLASIWDQTIENAVLLGDSHLYWRLYQGLRNGLKIARNKNYLFKVIDVFTFHRFVLIDMLVVQNLIWWLIYTRTFRVNGM